MIVQETYTETYTVNPDCTGTSEKKTSAGIDVNFAFVVLNHGQTIEYVETDPGAVLTLRAERTD